MIQTKQQIKNSCPPQNAILPHKERYSIFFYVWRDGEPHQLIKQLDATEKNICYIETALKLIEKHKLQWPDKLTIANIKKLVYDRLPKCADLEGCTATWTSGAQGSLIEKRGLVLKFIPAGKIPKDLYPELKQLSNNQIKFEISNITYNPKIIIEVKEENKKPIYYGPNCDKQGYFFGPNKTVK